MTCIGVVGAGVMGRGIAQLFAQAGHAVLLFDTAEGAARKAVAAVAEVLDRSVAKGRMTEAACAETQERLQVAGSLAGLAECGLVIEAVIERLDVKQGLFRELESILADPAAILASNTSSLTISEIAAACTAPQRVAGLHFFNPVPLMRLAEIVPGVRTDAGVVETLRALVAGTGHQAVVAADQPGFLVNHAGRALYTEGLRLLEENVTDPAGADAVLRDAAGFRMGPFELLDLTGLDVSGKVMTSIYDQFLQEPRYRPSALVPPRVAAGLFGRKVGRGWYEYGEGATRPAAAPVPEAASCPVWIDREAPGAGWLGELRDAAGMPASNDPGGPGLLLIQPWGEDATRFAAARGLDAARCVAVDPLSSASRRRTAMLTVATTPAMRDAAHALLASDGTAVTVINDSPGFIVQRVLALVVNVACHIAQCRIATVDDIEAGVQLGLNYPKGPLEWGDEIGADRVLAILQNLQAATGDPRYRPSPWLSRRAALGLSLRTPPAPRPPPPPKRAPPPAPAAGAPPTSGIVTSVVTRSSIPPKCCHSGR